MTCFVFDGLQVSDKLFVDGVFYETLGWELEGNFCYIKIPFGDLREKLEINGKITFTLERNGRRSQPIDYDYETYQLAHVSIDDHLKPKFLSNFLSDNIAEPEAVNDLPSLAVSTHSFKRQIKTHQARQRRQNKRLIKEYNLLKKNTPNSGRNSVG